MCCVIHMGLFHMCLSINTGFPCMSLLIWIGLFSISRYDKYVDEVGLFCMSLLMHAVLVCM